MGKIERRLFLRTAGAMLAVLATAPSRVLAQPLAGKTARLVGYLSSTRLANFANLIAQLDRGLGEHGFVVGRDVVLESRAAEGRLDSLPRLVGELLALKPSALVVETTPAVAIAMRETHTVPIVFVYVSDPVGSGFVDSLSHPGRNATGVTNVLPELTGKLLELLLELGPVRGPVGVLWNPGNPAKKLEYDALVRAAARLGVMLRSLPIRSREDIERAFRTMKEAKAAALVTLGEALTVAHDKLIADLALQQRLPSVFNLAFHVSAGGLLSYSPDDAAMFRRVGALLGKILSGSNPSDLPVERPVTFELVVNLKTAKSLNLMIPRSILLRADRVIE